VVRLEPVVAELPRRLRAERAELERIALDRISAISDPAQIADADYMVGLRIAVSHALDYGLEGIERGEKRPLPPPAELLLQARLAARYGVPLETVLRRYVAGYALLNDFVVRAARDLSLRKQVLENVMYMLATQVDHLLAAVCEEFESEEKVQAQVSGTRHVERIESLLAGEPADVHKLNYRLNDWHLGVVTCDSGVDYIRAVAKDLDRVLLTAKPKEDLVWGWLGGRSPVAADELVTGLQRVAPSDLPFGLGEPGEGIPGWRRTHEQASAAFSVLGSDASRSVARYADICVLIAVMRDHLLVDSLHHLYLAPLEHDRDGGRRARETLRAFFAADGNVSSAAIALGISRQSFSSRLRAIEERLGRSLALCSLDLSLALQLESLGIHR
jgi:hypothetical protein